MKKGFLLGLALISLPALVSAACIDHSKFDKILKSNVDTDGFVDYEGIRVNKGGDLYEYIAFLEDADMKMCSEVEREAFWINAYNAHAIRLVLARKDLKTISDDFKLFGEKFRVAKVNLSLNDIEHRVIRSSAKKGGPIEGVSLTNFDPRIHFALVCAAIDCPRLLNKAYQARNIEETLQSNAVNFANNPKHLRLEEGQLVVSSLMRWYGEDFDKLGGVKKYLQSLTDPALRPDANDIDAKLETDFPDNTKFKYDWTLNSVKNKK
jgi:hypothetical protein